MLSKIKISSNMKRVMNKLPDELLRTIGYYLKTSDRVHFSMVDKATYRNILIDEIRYTHMGTRYLTDAILRQPRFAWLKVLEIQCSSISNYGLENLQELEELCAVHCVNITDLNKLTKLKRLNVSYTGPIGRYSITPISDSGIRNLTQLEVLCIDNIPTIKNIGHMTSLKTLSMNGCCGVLNKNILSLVNITELHISNNRNITDINHMRSLRVLYADSRLVCYQDPRRNRIKTYYESCVMTDAGFAELDSLKELRAFNTQGIAREIGDIGDIEKEGERCGECYETDRETFYLYNT